jgi:hypothetical protein
MAAGIQFKIHRGGPRLVTRHGSPEFILPSGRCLCRASQREFRIQLFGAFSAASALLFFCCLPREAL